MDSTRFDHLAIAVGQRSTRRYALGLLAAVGLTGLLSEDAAAACLASGARCGGGRGSCCSGLCKGPKGKKTCRCPQRTCCQCDTGSVPCAFVTDFDACVARCEELTGNKTSSTFPPAPGKLTSFCEGTLCREANCAPPDDSKAATPRKQR
jgi:hypothetical protein